MTSNVIPNTISICSGFIELLLWEGVTHLFGKVKNPAFMHAAGALRGDDYPLDLLETPFFLEEDKRPNHDILPASRVGGRGRVDTGGMKRPARH